MSFAELKLRHRVDESGVLIVTPTRAEVQALSVGDMAPDCFGRVARVVEIFGRGDDVQGRAYACYYTEFGPGSSISGSVKEGATVATVPLTAKYCQAASVRA